jgi:exo-beta-1,3-glucanase (GH17 family)
MHSPTQSRPPIWQVTLVAGVLLAIAIGLTIQTWLAGRPSTLPDAAHEQFACASYTPSHNGHLLSLAEKHTLVASDLTILAQRFRCVRTYSVSEGLDEVPKVARQLGLKVMLGLWISSHAPSNDKEIAHGIALANQYSDVVTAVIVGNEVLLRREQTPAQMRALLERVRAGTSVPVTYADVWEFWLRNAELAEVASFVTIHILPYWEDQPIGIDHALDHVKNIYAKVQTAFPGKQVLIGETGWPSAGRPRLTAVPSLINEARFVREFVAYAEHNKIPYNLIEAFDQPWKRNQEGTVGGYWGLYNATGAAKFPFTGPVIAEPSWRRALIMALICTALFVAAGAALKPRPSGRALALLGIAGHAAGSMLFAQWQYVSTANRSWLEWLATSAWAISGWLAYVVICVTLARWLDGAALRQPASIASVVRSWGHGAPHVVNSRLLGVLRFLLLAGLAYVCLALTYEGRGRDFPLALIVLPITTLVLLDVLTRARAAFTLENEELLLAACIGLSALYIAWQETFVNTRAIAWSSLSLLYALLLCWRAMYPHQRAEHETNTTQLKGI